MFCRESLGKTNKNTTIVITKPKAKVVKKLLTSNLLLESYEALVVIFKTRYNLKPLLLKNDMECYISLFLAHQDKNK